MYPGRYGEQYGHVIICVPPSDVSCSIERRRRRAVMIRRRLVSD